MFCILLELGPPPPSIGGGGGGSGGAPDGAGAATRIALSLRLMHNGDAFAQVGEPRVSREQSSSASASRTDSADFAASTCETWRHACVVSGARCGKAIRGRKRAHLVGPSDSWARRAPAPPRPSPPYRAPPAAAAARPAPSSAPRREGRRRRRRSARHRRRRRRRRCHSRRRLLLRALELLAERERLHLRRAPLCVRAACTASCASRGRDRASAAASAPRRCSRAPARRRRRARLARRLVQSLHLLAALRRLVSRFAAVGCFCSRCTRGGHQYLQARSPASPFTPPAASGGGGAFSRRRRQRRQPRRRRRAPRAPRARRCSPRAPASAAARARAGGRQRLVLAGSASAAALLVQRAQPVELRGGTSLCSVACRSRVRRLRGGVSGDASSASLLSSMPARERRNRRRRRQAAALGVELVALEVDQQLARRREDLLHFAERGGAEQREHFVPSAAKIARSGRELAHNAERRHREQRCRRRPCGRRKGPPPRPLPTALARIRSRTTTPRRPSPPRRRRRPSGYGRRKSSPLRPLPTALVRNPLTMPPRQRN